MSTSSFFENRPVQPEQARELFQELKEPLERISAGNFAQPTDPGVVVTRTELHDIAQAQRRPDGTPMGSTSPPFAEVRLSSAALLRALSQRPNLASESFDEVLSLIENADGVGLTWTGAYFSTRQRGTTEAGAPILVGPVAEEVHVNVTRGGSEACLILPDVDGSTDWVTPLMASEEFDTMADRQTWMGLLRELGGFAFTQSQFRAIKLIGQCIGEILPPVIPSPEA